jgi:hypothetical protein
MRNQRIGLIVLTSIAFGLPLSAETAPAPDAAVPPADQITVVTEVTAVPAIAAVDARDGVKSWPEMTKKAALALIDKYGQPDEASDKCVAWNDKVPWARVVVNRDMVRDGSAQPDFIENSVWYKVPARKRAALEEFDGSLAFDKMTGMLSARSASEENNILALNLADEIIRGKQGAASAKSFEGQTLLMTQTGKSSDYTHQLLFSPRHHQ